MNIPRSRSRWSNEQDPEDRTDDGDRNMSISQDHSTYPLSLSPESADSRLQVGEGMAIRTFGPRTVDPRPDQNRREFLITGYRHVCR